jgi:hypothetical protein
MRIARPKRPEVAFKRKRSPPPQATKLLTYSMIAGVVFIMLLGIVFIPAALREQATTTVINPERGGQFRHDTSNGTRLYVDSVTASLGLSHFNATFWVDDVSFAHLDPGLGGGDATLSFTDARGNGLLDAGDFFAILPPATGCFRFEVYQVNIHRLAGISEWGACS